MSYSFLAQDRAFQAAQRAYDSIEPPCPADSFLDTEEGGKWLRETAEHVAEGGKFKVRGVLITMDCVIDALERNESVEWSLFCYAATCYALNPTDKTHAEREIRKSDLRAAATAMAMKMIAPHADTWAEEQRREQEDYL